MKTKPFKILSLIVVFFSSIPIAYAQEGKNIKHIRLKKSTEISLNRAPELIREKLKLSANDNLVKINSKTDELGFVHEKYQQTFKGVKVEFATYSAHARRNVLQTMNGELFNVNNVNTSPKLSKENAFQRAISHTGAEKYMWDAPESTKRAGNYRKPEGELVILPQKASGKKSARLAYKFDIYALKPLSRGYLYIDAQTGEALFFNPIIKHVGEHAHSSRNLSKINSKNSEFTRKSLAMVAYSGDAATRYSGTRKINTTKSDNNYVLKDDSRGNGVNTFNCQRTESYPSVNFTDSDNNWTDAEFNNDNKDNAALDAHWGAEMTYDYFLKKHKRNSYDGNGAVINSHVHYGQDYDNAFWNGSVMTYGDGSSNGNEGNGYFDALTCVDVAAHEIGHAICTNTADLVYRRESGALNEGFSDIWGACVEHFAKGDGSEFPSHEKWLIGDEIDRRSGAVALRSMSDPNVRNQPDTYGGTYWRNPDCFIPSSSNDYCGVHINSGVLNYWFYLLTMGGAGTNDSNDAFNVSAIGITKAAKIAYRAESVYLSSLSTFSDTRTAAINAATDLFGENSYEVKSVTDAWYAVGVGEAFSGEVSKYCSSKGNNSNNQYIDFVGLGDMQNSSGSDGGYKDFTSRVAKITKNKTNTLTLSAGFSGASSKIKWVVWIDYNQDGVFANKEKIVSRASSKSDNLKFDVTIPKKAKLGLTRMRVTLKNGSKPKACGTFENGEVEDYTVNITSSDSNNFGIINTSLNASNNEKFNLMIYPNPAANLIHINTQFNPVSTTYKVMNIMGSVLKSGNLTPTIDISDLNTGLYLLELNNGEEIITKKLMKK